jgi:hypothetical protein
LATGTTAGLDAVNGKAVILEKVVRSRRDRSDAAARVSMLAFLSDLHEQIEIQMIACTDDSLREVLADLKSKVENAGLIVTLSAGLKR